MKALATVLAATLLTAAGPSAPPPAVTAPAISPSERLFEAVLPLPPLQQAIDDATPVAFEPQISFNRLPADFRNSAIALYAAAYRQELGATYADTRQTTGIKLNARYTPAEIDQLAAFLSTSAWANQLHRAFADELARQITESGGAAKRKPIDVDMIATSLSAADHADFDKFAVTPLGRKFLAGPTSPRALFDRFGDSVKRLIALASTRAAKDLDARLLQTQAPGPADLAAAAAAKNATPGELAIDSALSQSLAETVLRWALHATIEGNRDTVRLPAADRTAIEDRRLHADLAELAIRYPAFRKACGARMDKVFKMDELRQLIGFFSDPAWQSLSVKIYRTRWGDNPLGIVDGGKIAGKRDIGPLIKQLTSEETMLLAHFATNPLGEKFQNATGSFSVDFERMLRDIIRIGGKAVPVTPAS